MGRPSSYTVEIGSEICEEIATTDHSLLSICSRNSMPSQSMVYRWLEDYPLFREKYARARERQADILASQTIEIADSSDPADAAKTRLQVDSRKWYASKLAPKKYGDRLELAGELEVKQSWADTLRERRAKRAQEKTQQ